MVKVMKYGPLNSSTRNHPAVGWFDMSEPVTYSGHNVLDTKKNHSAIAAIDWGNEQTNEYV